MFTAWDSQTPFRQIGYKGTEKYAQIQGKRAKSLLLGDFSLYLGCVGWQ